MISAVVSWDLQARGRREVFTPSVEVLTYRGFMQTSWGAGLLALGQANKGLAAVVCEG